MRKLFENAKVKDVVEVDNNHLTVTHVEVSSEHGGRPLKKVRAYGYLNDTECTKIEIEVSWIEQ